MSTNAEEVETLRRKNDELRKTLEHLERYSRDFNIRVLGVNEDEGEDCMTKITDLVTSLGFDATAEIENAHPMGKKRSDKPRSITIRLYSRPFKRSILQVAKSTNGKAILPEVPGGGGYLTKFVRGGSAPRSNPLPFHIPFWQKRYPFYIPFTEKRYPFHIPILGSLVLVFM